jgi:hypothetical protein
MEAFDVSQSLTTAPERLCTPVGVSRRRDQSPPVGSRSGMEVNGLGSAVGHQVGRCLWQDLMTDQGLRFM